MNVKIVFVILSTVLISGCIETKKNESLRDSSDKMVKYNIILINRSGQKLKNFHLSNTKRSWKWFSGRISNGNHKQGYMLMDFDPSKYVKVSFDNEKGEKYEANFTNAIPKETYGNTFSEGDGDVVFVIDKNVNILMELENLETDEIIKIQPDSKNPKN
jgi:hypothetical protein